MTADGEEVTLEEVSQNLSIRDTADARQWEPLLKSGDAIVIDTSDMTIQEVVDSLASRLPGRT
jgi:cytidylate kinase